MTMPSATLVHPTQRVEIFLQYCCTFL